jgi:hypothetical protein
VSTPSSEIGRKTRVARFGVFEADLDTRELRKQGQRIRLQDQPFAVLAILLERPGVVISREDIRQKLWPADTFVDFDHSLNTAINKVRDNEVAALAPNKTSDIMTVFTTDALFTPPNEPQLTGNANIKQWVDDIFQQNTAIARYTSSTVDVVGAPTVRVRAASPTGEATLFVKWQTSGATRASWKGSRTCIQSVLLTRGVEDCAIGSTSSSANACSCCSRLAV